VLGNDTTSVHEVRRFYEEDTSMRDLSGRRAPRSLPHFNSHEGHAKLVRLTDDDVMPPDPSVQAWLSRIARTSPGEMRILDIGCGRGEVVAWLCREGWDAYGSDICEEYLAQGAPYFADRGLGDRLLHNGDREWPFPSGMFDVVISSQVLEHVADLDGFAAEQARVSHHGARGLHVFPAKFRPVETHMLMPFVHWLPKGRIRRVALHAALRAKIGAPYFADLPIRDRLAIFNHFSETDTYYRRLAEIRRTFARHGIRTEHRSVAQEKMQARLPPMLAPVAAAVYPHVGAVYLSTNLTA
jgi:SAM-dependent methyltransferase